MKLTPAELDNLYRVRLMSIHKISGIYGVDRRTVKRWLMRTGIPFRSHDEATDLIRKHDKPDPSILWDLYWNSKYSLEEIGQRLGASYFWVRTQMLNAGIPLRPPWKITYVSKPFSGYAGEEAYLKGLRTGDLSCIRSGHQVKAATTTTHPGMVALLDNCLGSYGHVGKIPSRNKQSFEWSVYSYLNESFAFMLNKCTTLPDLYRENDNLFLSFLSGYVDAEGSFRIYRDGELVGVSLRLRTEDKLLLIDIRNVLRKLGYHPYLALDLEPGSYQGKNYHKEVWTLGVFRKDEILSLLPRLTLKHSEKISWANLVLRLSHLRWNEAEAQVVALKCEIKAAVSKSVRVAEDEYVRRHPMSLLDFPA